MITARLLIVQAERNCHTRAAIDITSASNPTRCEMEVLESLRCALVKSSWPLDDPAYAVPRTGDMTRTHRRD